MFKEQIIVFVVGLLFLTLLGSVLVPYTINSWLEYFEQEPAVQWYHGMLLILVPGVGQLFIPASAITWVLMLIL